VRSGDGPSGPRVSVNQLCLPETTFVQDVELARTLGYDGISVDAGKVPGGAESELAELLDGSGLRAAVCCGPIWSILPMTNFPEPADPMDRIAHIRTAIERLARFRPASVFCALGVPAADLADSWRVIDYGLRAIRDIAAQAGTTLSVEPMTREGTGLMRQPLAPSIDATLDLLDRLGFDDASVVADIWHLHDSDDFLDSLRANAGRISALQMCDYHPPRTWRDRLMPGAGSGRVRAALSALDEGGFDGWLDLEVFSDELWALGPQEFMRRGLAAISDCWRTRGDEAG
jgi:sugar phosphate isomerase/epimerase